MKENVRNKLNEVAGGLDLSSLMPQEDDGMTLGEFAGSQGGGMPGEAPAGMPEVSVDAIYSEIAPKLAVLGAEEMLGLMGMILSDRSAAQAPMEMPAMDEAVLPPVM